MRCFFKYTGLPGGLFFFGGGGESPPPPPKKKLATPRKEILSRLYVDNDLQQSAPQNVPDSPPPKKAKTSRKP